MARGTTLPNLRLMLRAELGQTLDTSAATQMDASYTKLLYNKQLWLAASYDWPFLKDVMWDVAIAPGDRYLSMPTNDIRGTAATINFERPFQVNVKYNSRWQPVRPGIGVDEYNVRDSDRIPVESQDPVQKFELRDYANGTQKIEIWPVPTTASTIRITGNRTLAALSADSDVCDLDDLLLVLTVAAEQLAGEESPKAQLIAQLAGERFQRITSAYPQNDFKLVLGKNQYTKQSRKVAAMVVVTAP